LIGLDTPDDASVWSLGDGRVVVLTTDFYTPVVDDAYDYGAIAAANSLSDVHAMGAVPFLALTLAALPPTWTLLYPKKSSAAWLRNQQKPAPSSLVGTPSRIRNQKSGWSRWASQMKKNFY